MSYPIRSKERAEQNLAVLGASFLFLRRKASHGINPLELAVDKSFGTTNPNHPLLKAAQAIAATAEHAEHQIEKKGEFYHDYLHFACATAAASHLARMEDPQDPGLRERATYTMLAHDLLHDGTGNREGKNNELISAKASDEYLVAAGASAKDRFIVGSGILGTDPEPAKVKANRINYASLGSDAEPVDALGPIAFKGAETLERMAEASASDKNKVLAFQSKTSKECAQLRALCNEADLAESMHPATGPWLGQLLENETKGFVKGDWMGRLGFLQHVQFVTEGAQFMGLEDTRKRQLKALEDIGRKTVLDRSDPEKGVGKLSVADLRALGAQALNAMPFDQAAETMVLLAHPGNEQLLEQSRSMAVLQQGFAPKNPDILDLQSFRGALDRLRETRESAPAKMSI